MSSENPPATTMPENKVPTVLRVFSHCTLFYWWPVWVVGFILTGLTALEGQVMAVVPKDTTIQEVRPIEEPNQIKKALVPAAEKELPSENPKLQTSGRKTYGVVFAVVLLLVIVITNVPLRGMWSVLIIMLIVLLSIIFALAGWWERILSTLDLLDIRINLGGYLLISSVLFLLWAVTVFFFDRQIYVEFEPGQFKIRQEIGEGEKSYDTRGMTIEKIRSDLFRHWVLGLGSGDMIIRTSGADAHEFRLDNILFIGKKLEMVENMQRLAGTPRA